MSESAASLGMPFVSPPKGSSEVKVPLGLGEVPTLGGEYIGGCGPHAAGIPAPKTQREASYLRVRKYILSSPDFHWYRSPAAAPTQKITQDQSLIIRKTECSFAVW